MDEQLLDDKSQPPPKDKVELLERIHATRSALTDATGRLSDAQLVAPGPYEGWSVKDHLAHLAAWELGLAALLRREPRYAAMQVDMKTYLSGADAVNAVVYLHNRDRTLADVQRSFTEAHEDVLAAIDALSAADLLLTYSHYQPDEPGEDSGEPIVRWIAGNTYEHYAEHQEWIEALVR